MGELLAEGVTVQPQHAFIVRPIIVSHGVPIAAEHAERRARELAARRFSTAHNWRAHEAMLGLALDMGELKDAEKEVEEKQARVATLEFRLEALERTLAREDERRRQSLMES